MEPASVQTKEGKRKGRGSLESPELYENVPGHVIPILEREFDDFDSEASTFLAGKTEETEFIGFRLKQGVYGQRQADVQMIRVKLPFGGVTPSQMEAFASVIEKYAPLNRGHITTRQNIQIHHVPLTDAAKLIRELGDAGLSSREGCGNTVRNVTGDPWAGVSHDEPFDPTPYAGAFVRYFVRNDVCQLLPRKFKVAFTASDEDRAITGIHDLGLIPRVREVDGREVRGFEMRVGGGTSIMPRIAPSLYEFVAIEDGAYLRVTEAILRIFDRQEWLRANRARARIKVLVDKIGIDAFREQVEEELRGDWVAERDFSLEPLLFVDDELAGAPAVPESYASPNGDRSRFDAFRATNVRPQRQEGFSTVEVKVTRGDLTPDQLRSLADIMREFSGGYARTTVHQNLLLRWVRDEAVYDVWRRLRGAGPGRRRRGRDHRRRLLPGHRLLQARHHQLDGAQPGGAGAPGAYADRRPADAANPHQDERLPQRLQPAPHRQHRLLRRLDQGGRQDDPRLRRPPGRQLRGRHRAHGHAPQGAPARPSACPTRSSAGCATTRRAAQEGEAFNDFVARVGEKEFEDVVRDLAMPVEFSLDTMNHFIDWNRGEPFKVVRGEGECAV